MKTSEWWDGYGIAQMDDHAITKHNEYTLLGNSNKYEGDKGKGYRAYIVRKYPHAALPEMVLEAYPDNEVIQGIWA